jgi:hypothetical protein
MKKAREQMQSAERIAAIATRDATIPGQRGEAWFEREIAPKLDAFSLKEIAKARGLSLAACSRIRATRLMPPFIRHRMLIPISPCRGLEQNHCGNPTFTQCPRSRQCLGHVRLLTHDLLRLQQRESRECTPHKPLSGSTTLLPIPTASLNCLLRGNWSQSAFG